VIQASLFAYFVLVAVLVVLVVFPGWRAQAASTFRHFFGTLTNPVFRSLSLVSRSMDHSRSATSSGIASASGWIARNRLLAALALAALVLPSLLVVVTRGPAIFDFAEQGSFGDRQITLLLEGEQLVPPAALPPEVFTTREVELIRPDIAYASRDWALLDQEFVHRLLVVFKLMKERHGYQMALIEGYRSPQRQEELLAQGAHVTRAGANMSYHQHGLAADVAFFVNGRVVISERDPQIMRAYQLYGEIAEQVGLTWGGRWKMQDYGHVELRRPGVLGSET
jgi:peptidoglycan L-alanyl-D-glutamate endopeptidase CwlK